jgi:hypothetical protein
MRLIGIRDPDGPNIFLLEPAIKVEFETAEAQAERDALDQVRRAVVATAGGEGLAAIGAEIGPVLCDAVRRLHVNAGVSPPVVMWINLEVPDHVALAFGWSRRRFARALAEQLVACATGQSSTFDRAELQRLLALRDHDDRPLLVRDDKRTVRPFAVTGTNGKPATTRCPARRRAAACSLSRAGRQTAP